MATSRRTITTLRELAAERVPLWQTARRQGESSFDSAPRRSPCATRLLHRPEWPSIDSRRGSRPKKAHLCLGGPQGGRGREEAISRIRGQRGQVRAPRGRGAPLDPAWGAPRTHPSPPPHPSPCHPSSRAQQTPGRAESTGPSRQAPRRAESAGSSRQAAGRPDTAGSARQTPGQPGSAGSSRQAPGRPDTAGSSRRVPVGPANTVSRRRHRVSPKKPGQPQKPGRAGSRRVARVGRVCPAKPGHTSGRRVGRDLGYTKPHDNISALYQLIRAVYVQQVKKTLACT